MEENIPKPEQYNIKQQTIIIPDRSL